MIEFQRSNFDSVSGLTYSSGFNFRSPLTLHANHDSSFSRAVLIVYLQTVQNSKLAVLSVIALILKSRIFRTPQSELVPTSQVKTAEALTFLSP